MQSFILVYFRAFLFSFSVVVYGFGYQILSRSISPD